MATGPELVLCRKSRRHWCAGKLNKRVYHALHARYYLVALTRESNVAVRPCATRASRPAWRWEAGAVDGR